MDEKEFTLQARNCAERLIQVDWTVPMKHGDVCWQRAVNSGIEYKSTSVEGNLAGTSMIRKGQRRLVKEEQKTEIGQLRILHTRVRSLNFILKAMSNLWRIFCRDRSDLSLKDHSGGSVVNGWVLNICWVNEGFLNVTIDLTIW